MSLLVHRETRQSPARPSGVRRTMAWLDQSIAVANAEVGVGDWTGHIARHLTGG